MSVGFMDRNPYESPREPQKRLPRYPREISAWEFVAVNVVRVLVALFILALIASLLLPMGPWAT
jgi:hypothetical protein